MNEAIEIPREELTPTEQLEIDLADSRAREAELALAAAQRAVADFRAARVATHQRIVNAALARRAEAAKVSTPANRAERRAKGTKKS